MYKLPPSLPTPSPLAPPTITPSSIAVVLSQSATFACAVEGTAPLQLQWLRGASRLVVEEEGSRVQLTNGSLSISSVEREDEGSYTCRAVFAGGVTQSEAYLDVLGE